MTMRQIQRRKWEHPENEDRQHKCLICSKAYLFGYDLRRHSERYHTENKISCEECDRQFSTVKCLELHIASHPGRPFACPSCKRKFEAKRQLKTHQLRMHSKPGKHQCLLCSKSYHNSDSLTKHLNKVHFTPEKDGHESTLHSKFDNEQLKIKIDPESDGTEDSNSKSEKLETPIMSSTELKTTFICDECGHSFIQCFSLENHKLEHEQLTEPLECIVCGEEFDTWWKRKEHMNIKLHNRVREQGQAFQCDECNLTFTRKDKIDHHILEEHIKPNICIFGI